MASIVSIIAEVNGQTIDLTKPSSGNVWTKAFAAPNQTSGSHNSGQGPGVGAAASGLGYYPVKVTVTDEYGNTTVVTTSTATLGESLKLKVEEKTAPVAAIMFPASNASISNGKPTVTFTLTDSGSGINPAECYVQIDNGTAAKVTATGSGTSFTGSYTPATALGDGNHTVVVYGYDYDGNKSNEASSTFKIDTTPPVLNVTAPTDGLKTNEQSLTVTGTTNDVSSTPVTVAIKLNGTDQGPVTVESGGQFSKVITLTTGENTIEITATDSSGLKSTVTKKVYFSDAKPVITAITLVPNPQDVGGSVTISVTVQE